MKRGKRNSDFQKKKQQHKTQLYPQKAGRKQS